MTFSQVLQSVNCGKKKFCGKFSQNCENKMRPAKGFVILEVLPFFLLDLDHRVD
jgi:hypothetical protein